MKYLAPIQNIFIRIIYEIFYVNNANITQSNQFKSEYMF